MQPRLATNSSVAGSFTIRYPMTPSLLSSLRTEQQGIQSGVWDGAVFS